MFISNKDIFYILCQSLRECIQYSKNVLMLTRNS